MKNKNHIKKIGAGFLAALSLIAMSFTATKKSTSDTHKSIYDLSILSIDGKTINLSDYKGKKILFVNVASKCGYTPQYEGLQKLHETYGEDVAIIGVPCNQFMNQEPGTNEEIVGFCQKNYGVSFTLTEKVNVKGKEQHELYTWLTTKTENGVSDSKVQWNFQKYLINEKGELMEVFPSGVAPLDDKLVSLL